MIKSWFIKKTNREGIIYNVVDYSLFKLQCLKHNIFYGHFVRRLNINKYLYEHSVRQKKLHLGCGYDYLPEYLNSDVFGEIPIDITHKLPFDDETFDVIFTSHLVEHIYNRQGINFFKEIKRILKKDGIYINAFPSLEKISKIIYGKNSLDKENILEHHGKFLDDKEKNLTAVFMNNMIHLHYAHKYLYDFQYLSHLSKEIGFSSATLIKPKDIKDDALRELVNKKIKNGRLGWSAETEFICFRK